MTPTAQSDRVLLEHMLDCMSRIREYTGVDRETFFSSRLIQDAVIRNLQVMAESSQRLSESIKNTETSIPWVQIAGMRNILVHQYLGGIDLETVWSVIERHLAPSEQAVKRMRERLDTP
jgi:uncharacterized protein with HEPN domain